MCRHCQYVSNVVLLTVLRTAHAGIILKDLEREHYASDEAFAEALKNRDEAARFIDIIRKLHETFGSPDLSPDESVSLVADLVHQNHETRFAVRDMIRAAKFTHYASHALRAIGDALLAGLEVRAIEETDPEAVRFVLDHTGNEMRRGRDQRRKRRGENATAGGPQITALPVPEGLLDAILKTLGDAGDDGSTQGSGDEPDYKH